MKEQLENVIKTLAADVNGGNRLPHESQQLAQAALSFGHILVMLKDAEAKR